MHGLQGALPEIHLTVLNLPHGENLSSHDVTGPRATEVSAILLAGGGSRRMGGRNKALLEVGGSTLVERIVACLQPVFAEILLITQSPDSFAFLGLPTFPDLIPGQGPLGGLYTGLSHCSGRYAFLVACDMPFVDSRVVRYLIDRIDDHDVVIPRIRERLEPLHAIYSKRCLPHIEAVLHRHELKIINFLDQVSVREIADEELAAFDPELTFLLNLNTPEDLEAARMRCRSLSERTPSPFGRGLG